jgi:hypothetical protein
MAQKNFTNETPYALDVVLTVRAGSDPGHEAGRESFTLAAHQSRVVAYGSPSDPYLDAIEATGNGHGNTISAAGKVVTRGSSVDDGFNTNDHVTFAMSGDSIVMSFRNG